MIICISMAIVAIFTKFLLNQVNPKISNLPIICASIVFCILFAEKYKETIALASSLTSINPSVLNMTNTILLSSIGEKLSEAAGEKGLSTIIKSIGLCLVAMNAISLFSDVVSEIVKGGYV